MTQARKPIDESVEKKHYAWRKAVATSMPELCARVFALRGTGYYGSGTHYELERRLGSLMSRVNDPGQPFGYEHVVGEELLHEELLEAIAQAEWSIHNDGSPTDAGAPWAQDGEAEAAVAAGRRIYTRTTEDFDPENPVGTLVCGAHLDDTYGFCEHGYDSSEMDYDEPPVVWEVIPEVDRFVTLTTLVSLCNEAGLRVFETYEDYEAERAYGYEGPAPGRDDFYCLEELSLNQLLEVPVVQQIAEDAGYQAGRDYIVVSNTQPLVTVFWKHGTFRLEGPVPVSVNDPDYPQNISLAGPGMKP
jgi:hypothetical protein